MAKKVIFGFLVAFCVTFFVSAVSASEPLSLEEQVFSIDSDIPDVANPEVDNGFTLNIERCRSYKRLESPIKSESDLYQSYPYSQITLNVERRPNETFT